MMSLPPQLPHGPIREILEDVFFVTGQTRAVFGGREFRFSRNMTIIRDGGVLTLLNTMRLDEDGLSELAMLGDVRHIAKLGFFHGRDDAFYKQHFGAKLWAFPGMPHERGLQTDVELRPSGPTPFGLGQAFSYASAEIAEGLMLLKRHGGVLVACDSLQNLAPPDEFFDEATAQTMRPPGLKLGMAIGPGFRNRGKPKASDFARLLELEFSHLLSAHGPAVLSDAHARVTECIATEFGRRAPDPQSTRR